jgi:hypothetical protein
MEIADPGDGFQIWRVAANILSMQIQTANIGWSSSLGVGQGGLTNPRRINYNVTKCYIVSAIIVLSSFHFVFTHIKIDSELAIY